MIPSSRHNLNTGNPFFCIPKQLPESDSNNNFLPQPNALTKIRLYPENKIWIWIILLSWVNKQLWILIPSLNISHCRIDLELLARGHGGKEKEGDHSKFYCGEDKDGGCGWVWSRRKDGQGKAGWHLSVHSHACETGSIKFDFRAEMSRFMNLQPPHRAILYQVCSYHRHNLYICMLSCAPECFYGLGPAPCPADLDHWSPPPDSEGRGKRVLLLGTSTDEPVSYWT